MQAVSAADKSVPVGHASLPATHESVLATHAPVLVTHAPVLVTHETVPAAASQASVPDNELTGHSKDPHISPSGQQPRDNASLSREDARRGYESDFESFMSKMFSQMPLNTTTANIDQGKKPPNPGYMPYWHGYTVGKLWNLAPQRTRPDESYVQWDYGLGGAGGGGRAVYLPRITPLLGDDAQLGAGAALRDEADYIGWDRPNVSVLLGPTGILGPGPNDYSEGLLEDMISHTSVCRQCSDKDANVGTVCVMDKKGQYREMTRCMMLQMNCLRGTAVTTSQLAKFHLEQIYVPQDRWARVSVKGSGNAWILLSEDQPNEVEDKTLMGKTCVPNYLFGLSSPTRGDNFFKHYDSAYYLKWQSVKMHTGWCKMVYENEWREYSIVWQENGNVTFAEPRPGRRATCPAFTTFDTEPFEINYISVSGWENGANTFIVHDLLKDLQELAVGPCQLGAIHDFPEDTEEVFKLTQDNEAKYKERMKHLQNKGIGEDDAKWRPQEGSDAEY